MQPKRELRLVQIAFWNLTVLATANFAAALFMRVKYGDPIPESHSAWLGLLFAAVALETIRAFLVRLAGQVEALRSEHERR